MALKLKNLGRSVSETLASLSKNLSKNPLNRPKRVKRSVYFEGTKSFLMADKNKNKPNINEGLLLLDFRLTQNDYSKPETITLAICLDFVPFEQTTRHFLNVHDCYIGLYHNKFFEEYNTGCVPKDQDLAMLLMRLYALPAPAFHSIDNSVTVKELVKEIQHNLKTTFKRLLLSDVIIRVSDMADIHGSLHKLTQQRNILLSEHNYEKNGLLLHEKEKTST